ncbi:MAG: porin family protein [Muribaculaceae bacterium]|nr:porin family protein [Muribaculaceae bacterium]
MKKSIAVLALCLATAISSFAQFRWGATAGYNGNNLTFKQDIVSVSSTSGFTAGGIGELMFPGIGFGIDLGLMYNMQGAKVNLGQKKVWSSLGYGNENVTLHSLTIPFHLRFKWTRLNGLEDIIAPLIYGGPEFNIQVAHGKCKAFKYSGGDLSLTVGGGVELKKKWQITGGYSWGMTYALKTKLLDNYSAQSRQWHIRLAYFF